MAVSKWKLFFGSITAAAISNIAGILVGHPLDTVKVSIYFLEFIIYLKPPMLLYIG